MTDVKKNVTKAEAEAENESGTIFKRQTNPLSLHLSPSKSSTRKQTNARSSLSPPMYHMPYRSPGGRSTGTFALRRTTQHHYLPPPPPTISSDEIKRRWNLEQSSRNDTYTTIITKNEEDCDRSTSCTSISTISTGGSFLSTFTRNESDIGECKGTVEKNSEQCGKDGIKEILRPTNDNNSCCSTSSNTVVIDEHNSISIVLTSTISTEDNEEQSLKEEFSNDISDPKSNIVFMNVSPEVCAVQDLKQIMSTQHALLIIPIFGPTLHYILHDI